MAAALGRGLPTCWPAQRAAGLAESAEIEPRAQKRWVAGMSSRSAGTSVRQKLRPQWYVSDRAIRIAVTIMRDVWAAGPHERRHPPDDPPLATCRPLLQLDNLRCHLQDSATQVYWTCRERSVRS